MRKVVTRVAKDLGFVYLLDLEDILPSVLEGLFLFIGAFLFYAAVVELSIA